MELNIKINLDNEAYEHVGAELEDNLERIMMKIEAGIKDGIVRDTNGNKVGYFKIVEEINHELECGK